MDMNTLNQAVLNLLITSNKPFVVDFFATWCGPCKTLGNTLSEIQEEYRGKVCFAQCNVESEPDITEKYGIRNVPTVIFFAGGEEKKRLAGAIPKIKLKAEIDALIGEQTINEW